MAAFFFTSLHGLQRLLTSILIIGALVISIEAAGSDQGFDWLPIKAQSAVCEGSIGECMAGNSGGEFEMDTEINRRILATTNYISYSALQRNTVPCSRRGASYYNCHPGAEANPYTRGCSSITRCRS